jgi:hypothetical protein
MCKRLTTYLTPGRSMETTLIPYRVHITVLRTPCYQFLYHEYTNPRSNTAAASRRGCSIVYRARPFQPPSGFSLSLSKPFPCRATQMSQNKTHTTRVAIDSNSPPTLCTCLYLVTAAGTRKPGEPRPFDPNRMCSRRATFALDPFGVGEQYIGEATQHKH